MENLGNRQINRKLEGLTAPVDKADLWRKIQEQKDFPRKRKPLLPFFGGLLLVLLGVAIGVWWTETVNNSATVSPNQIKTSSHQPNHQPTVESALAAATKLPTTITGISTDQPVKNDDTQHIAQEGITRKPLRQTADFDIQKPIANAGEEASVDTQIEKGATAVGATGDSEVNDITAGNKVSPLASTVLSAQYPNSPKDQTAPLTVKTADLATQRKKSKWNIPLTPISQQSILHENTNKSIGGLEQAIPVLVGTIVPRRQNDWRFSIQGGIAGAFYYLESTSDDSTPVDFRKQHTRNKPSYLISVALTRLLNDNWYVFSGVQYSNFVQSFDYQQTELGDYELVNQSQPPYYVQNINIIDHQYYHRYQFMDIRAGLEHNWELGSWIGGLRAGITYNLSLRATGDLLDPAENRITLEDHETYYGQSKLSFFAEGTIYRPLFGGTSALLTAGWQSPRPMKSGNSSYLHEVSAIYLKLGVAQAF